MQKIFRIDIKIFLSIAAVLLLSCNINKQISVSLELDEAGSGYINILNKGDVPIKIEDVIINNEYHPFLTCQFQNLGRMEESFSDLPEDIAYGSFRDGLVYIKMFRDKKLTDAIDSSGGISCSDPSGKTSLEMGESTTIFYSRVPNDPRTILIESLISKKNGLVKFFDRTPVVIKIITDQGNYESSFPDQQAP